MQLKWKQNRKTNTKTQNVITQTTHRVFTVNTIDNVSLDFFFPFKNVQSFI